MIGLFTNILNISNYIGYWGIVLLMTIESSFIPFPSEVVIPPAAYLAQTGEMNIFLVILSGITGSLIGATINYYLSMTLGRSVIYYLANHKIAKILLINEKKIRVAEEYFLKYGKISTFIGRLVPAVRQLISIPAGFSKMRYKDFIFYTFLGSSAWIIILAILGYAFGANKELLSDLYHKIKVVAIIIATFFVIGLFYLNFKKKNKAKESFHEKI